MDLLWKAHKDSGKEISIICDPLLFFYDQTEGKLTRFVDTNIDESDRALALAELQRRHRKDFKETLMPGHFYVDIGQVRASDRLRFYFQQSINQTIPLLMNTDVKSKEILNSSPIMLGTIRTNKFIRQFFASPESHGLAYRLHPECFADIVIDHPNDEEKDVLESLGLKLAPGATGMVKAPSAEMTLGVVTRIPNPGGTGAITIISSDGSLNTGQMAAALTDDRQLERILDKIDWPLTEPLPNTFEWLFLVRLWPGDLSDEAREAELLAWRPLS